MTTNTKVDAIVAGHICLDILPDLTAIAPGQFEHLFQPGRLVQAGPAGLTPGGVVSNTGLALNRLGIQTRLIARTGDDPFGRVLRGAIAAHGVELTQGIASTPGSSTSYSIVISPPGSDRRFLHHPGANDEFCAQDVRAEHLQGARLFHFGYPPLMANMIFQEGGELAELFQWVKSQGLTTSLDMAYPDPGSPAGRMDWPGILRNVLPSVDLFVPSLDEITFMLRGVTEYRISASLLNEISAELLSMGAKMVLLKLGNHGLYLHTSELAGLGHLGLAAPQDLAAWADFEARLPCFQVETVGTTGAGDVTVAGFLAALLRGLPAEDALKAALAVGACCVEAVDALSGLRSWEETLQRVHSGWPTRPETIQFQK
ncbi:MAG: carbohydrate kinase family protein [Anaerolineaceae bacterium]|nr:carbohydrate kinase family protein [Anaerolineaceae bacterium]MBN2677331.1 carbohydrate kinase family protein [Anaerolineaceae bacterium]